MKKKAPLSVLCIGTDPVNLNLRCSALKDQGWDVVSSGSGHDGVFRFGKQHFDAVVLDLNDDGAEAALIASELKRQIPTTTVVMVIPSSTGLMPGATAQADAVVLKSQERRVLAVQIEKLLRPI